MHELGQRVPLSAINCIIQGCVNVRDMSRAFQTFDEIHRTFKLQPDVHSYNALLDGCGQARQVSKKIERGFILQLVIRGWCINSMFAREPDVQSYNEFLEAAGGHQKKGMVKFLQWSARE